MTAQPQSRPVRATSWLANWIDYAFAVVLVAGRLFRLPSRRREARLAHAYAPLGGAPLDSHRPQWHRRAEAEPQQHWLVRPAEIVMLSASFFLAAHLLGGGTREVRAPQLNPLSFLSSTAAVDVRAQALPHTGGSFFEFQAQANGANPSSLIPSGEALAPAVEDAAAEEVARSAADDPIPAPPDRGGAPAAAEAPAETPTSAPAAASTPQPTPTPVPAQPTPLPTAAPTVAPVAPAPGPSVLSYDALTALALQAGWPADRADEVARVAYCESRYKPAAVGFGSTYGLMQLVPLWFAASGHDFSLWSDPLTNLKVALYAFETDMSYGNDPWSPWSCKPWNVTLP